MNQLINMIFNIFINKEVVFLTIDSWFTDIKQVILRTLGFYHPLLTDFIGKRSSFSTSFSVVSQYNTKLPTPK